MDASPRVVSLLGDAIDQARAQRSAVAEIRRQLELGSDADKTEHASQALVVLARCLGNEAFAHEQTLREIRRALDTSGPSPLAPFIRRLHAEHEALLGLVGFAARLTADFLGPEDASATIRTIFAALGMWAGGQRTFLRSEREQLLPALLALDPELAPDVHPARMAMSRHDTLSTSGVVSETRVFCRGEGESVALEWCATCPLARHVGADEVLCTPGDRPCEPHHDVNRSGGEALVGEALPHTHLRVLPDVAAGSIAAALGKAPMPAVVVVDGARRFVRVVPTDAVLSSPATTPAADLRGDGASVAESVSLADAIAQMVHRHVRFLAVTRCDETVVGVLGDLDVLRWIARRRLRAP